MIAAMAAVEAAVVLGVAPVIAAAANALPVRSGVPLLDTHEDLDHLPHSPSVTGGSLSALANPAAWALSGETEVAFWWNDRALGEGGLGNHGLSIGRHLGFAYQRRVLDVPGGGGPRRTRFTDLQIGLATGDRGSASGIAWRWSAGEDEVLGREHGVVLGTIRRPSRFLSYGASLALSTESSARHGVADLGVRPLGSSLLTLFGEYALRNGETLDEGRWGGGVELRPVAGVHVGAKLRESLVPGERIRMTLNLALTLDANAFHVLPGLDEDGDRRATSYVVRMRAPARGLPLGRTLRRLGGDRRYVSVSLENKTLTYRRDRYLDTERVAWVDLLGHLDAIEREPTIAGVALNLAGLRTSGAIAWELRDRLGKMRRSGKEVIVHVDRIGFIGCYLASVGDVVSLDPEGSVRLAGLAAHRTFMAGTLEKLGIGFEEWRFFSHKSLLEAFSRESMSPEDREQRQRVVDVIYEEVRRGVTADRDLAEGAFDALVDEVVLLTPALACEHHLIDRIGRWHDLSNWLERERDASLVALPADARPRPLPDERWGSPPEIALVYALGECEMDTGIRGRATSAHLRSLASRRSNTAVVVRADSPGGRAQPSDLVAEGISLVRASGTPVVVSQGSVAASGGYWLGASATRVLTTPFTLTGSIGVAGGWAWDDGIGEKLGMRSDGVARGAHADLFTGLRFPFVSHPLPARNLDGPERERLREHYVQLYDRFVTHVAASRGLAEARVREIGEGRVWMGRDALDRDLVDGVGTLDDAIQAARKLAGLDADEEIVIREFPERRLYTLPSPARGLLPSFEGFARGMAGMLGIGRGAASAIASCADAIGPGDPFVEAVLAAPGEPLVVMPGGVMIVSVGP